MRRSGISIDSILLFAIKRTPSKRENRGCEDFEQAVLGMHFLLI
jgi:hypothetical protein